MKIIYLASIFIAGCASKAPLSSYQEPSLSMCLDGVVYNMIHDGCDNIYVAESHLEDIRVLSCRYSYVHQNSEPSMWLENDFYIMRTPEVQHIEGGKLLCADGNVTIVVSEKD